MSKIYGRYETAISITKTVSPGNQTRFQKPGPNALEAAGVFWMDSVVAANAGVFEHLTVVGQSCCGRRRGPSPGQCGAVGGAQMDHWRT